VCKLPIVSISGSGMEVGGRACREMFSRLFTDATVSEPLRGHSGCGPGGGRGAGLEPLGDRTAHRSLATPSDPLTMRPLGPVQAVLGASAAAWGRGKET